MSADRNTGIDGSQIKNLSIKPEDLKRVGSAPSDTYVPSYDSATGDFEWVAQGSLASIADIGDVDFDTGTPTDNNVLTYDSASGKWKAEAPAGGYVDKIEEGDSKVEVIDTGTGYLTLVVDGIEEARINASGLKLKSGVDINEFSIDGTLVGDSDDAIPTEKAVKTYVDGLTGIDDFTIKRTGGNLKVADRIEYNIMLLAFYRAVDNSKSIYNLLDGFIDEYEDETGIDTGASINESYDTTNDLYSPLFGGGGLDSDTKLLLHLNNNVTDSSYGVTGGDSPHTVTNNNVTFGTAKWGSHSGVFNGTTAYLTIPDSADWEIIANNTDIWTIDFWVKHTDHVNNEFYIAHREIGGNYDQWYLHHLGGSGLTFLVREAGSPIIDTGFGGEITDTNWHHICLVIKGTGSTKDIGIYKDGTQVNYTQDSDIAVRAGLLGIGARDDAAYPFFGSMDEIRIIKSNIFGASPNVGLTDTIDVPTGEYGAPSGGNMTLISNSQTADASPSDARIVIFEEDVDAITLNTDIKAYITRENGTGATWVQVTLTDAGNYEGNKRVLAGIVDLDVTGMGVGTDMAYKIETLNEKDCKIHGTGMNFD